MTRRIAAMGSVAMRGVAVVSVTTALAAVPVPAQASELMDGAGSSNEATQLAGLGSTDGSYVAVGDSELSPSSLLLTPDSGTVEVGKTLTFHYLLPDDGEVTVTSSDESVASVTVDPATHTVTVHAHKVGTATITVLVHHDGLIPHTTKATFTLTVIASTDGPGGSGSVTPAPSAHSVSVSDATGGSVKADHASAKEGDTVVVSVRPDAGYRTSRIAVSDAFGRQLSLSSAGEGSYSFTMPGSDVTVRAEFTSEAPKWFSDVDYSSWYASGVNLVSSKGLMNGYGGGNQFGVGKTLTRGELACVLFNYAMPGAGPVDYTKTKNETGMRDVQDGQFYTAAANWAVKNGIINGYGNADGSKTFGPYDPVTFEQLVAILSNLLSNGGASTADQAVLGKFADGSQTSDWSRGALAWAAEKGLVNGSAENGGLYLHATSNVNRERVAAVIKNSYELGLMK